MIVHDSWWTNEWASFNYWSTIIDYHVPFDQGFSGARKGRGGWGGAYQKGGGGEGYKKGLKGIHIDEYRQKIKRWRDVLHISANAWADYRQQMISDTTHNLV